MAELEKQALKKSLSQINWTAWNAQIISATIANLVKIWPLWLFIGLMLSVRLGYDLYRRRKLARSGIFEIDKMNGEEFEERLQLLYENLGFKVVRTGGRQGGDYSVDLVIEKDGERTAIQAKCYKHTKVGEAAVREAVAGKKIYHCYKAQVITNSRYTPMAWRLARANHVWLYDRNGLIKILLLEKAVKEKLAAGSRPL